MRELSLGTCCFLRRVQWIDDNARLSGEFHSPGRNPASMSLPLALASLPIATSRHSRQRCKHLLSHGRETPLSSGSGSSGGSVPQPLSNPAPVYNRPRQALVHASRGTTEHAAPDGSVVLDLLLPGVDPTALATTLFGCSPAEEGPLGQAAAAVSDGSSDGLLIWLMQERLGCTDLAVEPWSITEPEGSGTSSSSGNPTGVGAPAAGIVDSCTGSSNSSSNGSSRTIANRVVKYSMPLSRRQRLLLPLGPAAVPNTEEQRLQALPGGGLQVLCRCTSTGVPFADCFTNLLDWQLLPADADAGSGAGAASVAASLRPATRAGSSAQRSTRLLLTARCHFHRPVLGPLGGQIERGSLQAGRAGPRGVNAVPGSPALLPAFAPPHACHPPSQLLYYHRVTIARMPLRADSSPLAGCRA